MCPLKQIMEDIIGRLVSSQLFQLNESLSRMHESFTKTNGEYPWTHLVRFYKESQRLYSYFYFQKAARKYRGMEILLFKHCTVTTHPVDS